MNLINEKKREQTHNIFSRIVNKVIFPERQMWSLTETACSNVIWVGEDWISGLKVSQGTNTVVYN